LRKLTILLVAFCALFLFGAAAHAQQFDLTLGFSGVTGPKSTASAQTISGGTYPDFGLDFLFFKNLGVGFDAAFRAHQNLYQGFQPFRPFFYTADAVFAPPLGKRAQLEVKAGIGAESVHFYTATLTCTTFGGCNNFVSSNHFMGHVGGGVRLFVTKSIFIRPEAHLYIVHNNVEFSGSRVTRFGASIGYAFRNKE